MACKHCHKRASKGAAGAALSTARRKGYTIPANAKLIIGKVKVESVIMSHHYNREIPYRDTGKRPCDVRRRA